MKIAIVSPYGLDHRGGVQDQAIHLKEWMDAAGHEAWIVAPGSGEGWHPAGKVVLLPANRSMAPLALTPGAVRQALAAVAAADVVHLHEPLMPAVSIGVARRCRQPLVGTFHADPSPSGRRLLRLARGPLQRVVNRLQVVTAVSEVAAAAVSHLAAPRLIPATDLMSAACPRFRIVLDFTSTCPGRSLLSGFVLLDSGFASLAAALAFARARALAFVMEDHLSADR